MAAETGTVKWFSVEKGYGFIERDDGGDLFAHRTALADPEIRKLETGQRVQFHVEQSPKGPKATGITLSAPSGVSEETPRSAPAPEDEFGSEREPGLMTLDEQLERALGERYLRRR